MAVIDPDRTGGTPIPPPDIAGFPGLAGMVFTSPASGKDRAHNSSMRAQDEAEWLHYDWFINLNSFLKAAFLLGILYFVGMGANRKLRTMFCVNHDRQNYFRIPSRTGAAWKQYIFYAPLCGKNKWKKSLIKTRSRDGMYSMTPTRIQAFSVVLYFAACITFSLLEIDWSKEKRYILEDLRNRTGVLAIENMLPAFLFIMRSNPVMWMTGISRECNTFIHMWFSYAAVGLSLVHAALWMAGRIMFGSWQEVNVSARKNYLWTAWMATAALILLCLTSISPVRRAWYEVFGNLHSFLTFIFLAGIYSHMKFIPHKTLVVATILLWALERGLRVLQLLWRNAGKKPQRTPAVIELLPGSMMRITLTPVRGFRALGGKYLMLWIPSVATWHSHPFAPAWDNTPLDDSVAFSPKRTVIKKKKNDEEVMVVETVKEKKTVTILVRRRGGFTDKLAEKVESAGGRLEVNAWVEGPYTNSNVSFVSYGHVVLLAGGAGITAQLARAAEVYALRAKSFAVARKIHIFWYVKKKDHIDWIAPFITKMKDLSVHQDLIRIRIFITDETPSMESLVASETWQSKSSGHTSADHRWVDGKVALPKHISVHDKLPEEEHRRLSDATDDRSHYEEDDIREVRRANRFSLLNMYESPVELVQVEYRRPSIQDLIEEEMNQQVGAMILSVCGPPSMSNAARQVAMKNQMMGTLDFVEEGFTQ